MTQKEYKEYADLYGWENTVLSAMKDFEFVSMAPKCVSLGSRTYKTSQFTRFNGTDNIKRVICHRDGSITLKCGKSTLKFWN